MQPDNALFGCRMLSSFISVVWRLSASEAIQGDGARQKRKLENQYPVYTRHTRFLMRWYELLAPSPASPSSRLAQALFKTVNHLSCNLITAFSIKC